MNQYSPPRLPLRLAPKRCVRRGKNLVRISDDARDCSVFLGFSLGDDFKVVGTGFAIVYLGGADKSIFLVTAAHVAKSLIDTPFAIRMNADNGAAGIQEIERGSWVFHEDKNVDIAILPFDPPDWSEKTLKCLPTSYFLDDELENNLNIGAGDSVQVVGLFRLKQLKQKNLPIVHTGHIALIQSDESFPMGKGADTIHVKAHMVEISGLEGLSGSPAYVRNTVTFDSDAHDFPGTTVKAFTTAPGGLYLLGVWVGAWPAIPDSTLKNELGIDAGLMVPVGMGFVIPAKRIMEILHLPEIEDMRTKAIRERDDSFAARPLFLPVAPRANGENPTHREDFSRLLNVAAKTSPQDG